MSLGQTMDRGGMEAQRSGNLDQNGNCGNGEKWTDFRFLLKEYSRKLEKIEYK